MKRPYRGSTLPPVKTKAVGYVGLKFQDDLSRLVYIVNAEDVGNVTGIYIYQRDRNHNGTIVLDLLNGTRPIKKNAEKLVNTTEEGKITGTISIGGAKKSELQGPLKDKSLSELHM